MYLVLNSFNVLADVNAKLDLTVMDMIADL